MKGVAKLKLPELPPVRYAKIKKWGKQEGDLVEVGDDLLLIETEAVILVVSSPIRGVITKIILGEGTRVKGKEVYVALDMDVDHIAYSPPRSTDTADSPLLREMGHGSDWKIWSALLIPVAVIIGIWNFVLFPDRAEPTPSKTTTQPAAESTQYKSALPLRVEPPAPRLSEAAGTTDSIYQSRRESWRNYVDCIDAAARIYPGIDCPRPDLRGFVGGSTAICFYLSNTVTLTCKNGYPEDVEIH